MHALSVRACWSLQHHNHVDSVRVKIVTVRDRSSKLQVLNRYMTRCKPYDCVFSYLSFTTAIIVIFSLFLLNIEINNFKK